MSLALANRDSRSTSFLRSSASTTEQVTTCVWIHQRVGAGRQPPRSGRPPQQHPVGALLDDIQALARWLRFGVDPADDRAAAPSRITIGGSGPATRPNRLASPGTHKPTRHDRGDEIVSSYELSRPDPSGMRAASKRIVETNRRPPLLRRCCFTAPFR